MTSRHRAAERRFVRGVLAHPEWVPPVLSETAAEAIWRASPHNAKGRADSLAAITSLFAAAAPKQRDA